MPRDTIAIAFHQSAYATPATDHTIPGNRSGHRDLRLGRLHAPDPTTRDALTCALYVPGAELGTNGLCATDLNNHTRHTLLPRDVHNGSYILHAPHGGRRHFAADRGAEAVWQRGLRFLPPPTPEAARRAPACKGLGVFNSGAARRRPEVAWARAERERRAERGRAGKAIVYRRPDHAPVELGLCGMYGGCAAGEAPLPAVSGAGAGAEEERQPPVRQGEKAEETQGEKAEETQGEGDGGAVASLPPLAFGSAGEGTGWGKVYYGTRRSEQRLPTVAMASAYAARRRKEAVANARLEDIRLVQLLPK